MSGESQLTFDDVLQTDTPDELYSLVSGVADAIVENERERSGDNCATISQRETDSADEYVFCVQLPPRTEGFAVETVHTAGSQLNLSFAESSVTADEEPPYVTWLFMGEYEDVESLSVLIVKPIESVESDEDDEEEQREIYEQFDFTRFVRQTE